jgi:hypothetical protein
MRAPVPRLRAYLVGAVLLGFALLNGASPLAAVVCTYVPLASGTSVSVPAEGFYEYVQIETAWTAIAIRPASGSDWDLFAYSTTAADPFCLAGDLTSSYRFTGVDLVVGDFHHNPLGTYYVGPTRPFGAGPGFLEWDGGAEVLIVDAAPVARTVSSGNIVEIWDVALQAGQTYTIAFERTGSADVRALVFRNPGTTYWASRDERELEIVAPTAYQAPATDIYAIAVVNDDGGDGDYQLAVLTGLVAAPTPGMPSATVLRGLVPNPMTQKSRIDFDLSTAGRVAFDVLDANGRIVMRLAERDYGAGRWSASLAPGASGYALSAGVYFVRMRVDGRDVGVAKVVLVE